MEKQLPLVVAILLSFTTKEILCYSELGEPFVIRDENWKETLDGEWMIKFMAPWCPACRDFASTWKDLAKHSDDLNINVGVVDVTENPGLSGRFLVTSLPSILHIKNGDFRVYVGPRTLDDLISFVKEEKWKDIGTISWWLRPDSFQMSAVSLFFKLAMFMRSLFNLMTDQYGIPEWGCYVIFAIATLLTGLILGLLIVCCCDLIFPPKYGSNQIRKTVNTQGNESEDLLKDNSERDDESDILDDTIAADTDTTRKRAVQSSSQD